MSLREPIRWPNSLVPLPEKEDVFKKVKRAMRLLCLECGARAKCNRNRKPLRPRNPVVEDFDKVLSDQS